MKKKILFIITFLLPFLAISQTATIKGIVKDDAGKPVPSAIVRVQGTSIQSRTDSTGMYELKNVPFGESVIVIDDKIVTATETINVDKVDMHFNISARNINMHDASTESGEIPVVSLGNDEQQDPSSSSAVSSELNASRDAFTSATSFIFSSARFRIRGYESENSFTVMNGALVSDLAFGSALYSSWSGLNDVIRNRETSYGLRATNYSFGNIGGLTNIDSRASRQIKQFKVSYASSNRTYRNRIVATYGSGVSKKGWAYSLSYARRWADEGYVPGTFYDGNSFYFGVDKVVNLHHTVSLTAFAAKTKVGRSAAATQESFDLAGTNYYNPNWGYQDGKKRNAVVSDNFQPLFILSHDWKINEKSTLQSAVTYQFGKNKLSGIDWYKAEDARPDYYRYLPSFDPAHGDDLVSFVKDSTELAQYLTNNPNAMQIDWAKIYLANQFSDTAKYIQSNRVTDAKRIGFNTTYNSSLTDHILLSAGLSFQKQDLEYYKEVSDMLGGNYFLDLNQFADLTNPSDSAGIQNDLNNPNRSVVKGDKYGFDYIAHMQKSSLWAQTIFKYDRFDYFIAAQVEMTQFYRTGKVRNGAFKDNSFGDSEKHKYTDPSVKGGITYKYNGRNYFFVNATYSKRAPLFRNAYISPSTRDQVIDNLTDTKIISTEGGYSFRSPRLKIKATAFYTQFKDQTVTLRYYDGDFNTFVNTTVTGIDRSHTGIEIGVDASLGQGFGASAVASIGQYLYTSRPLATVSQDNKDTLLSSNETIYLKNIRVGGFPQGAYSLGLNYRSPKYWYVYMNLNYFSNYHVAPNVSRRTITALDLVNEGSAQWQDILSQEKRDGEFSIDISGGWSWKLNSQFKSLKRNSYLGLNIGITNVLDNKDITYNAYEQSRFDTNTHDVKTFPTKYSYAFGRTYFASLTFRFN